MPREVAEWQGKTPDTPIPARVKLRVKRRHDDICVKCGNPVNDSFRKPAFDHRIALINWTGPEPHGGNCESNLQLLCVPCHRVKTQVDVAVKASHARRIKKRYGLTRKRNPMPGTRASGIRKRMNGKVERW